MSANLEFGEIGVWASFGRIGQADPGEAARAVEDAGYGTFWLGGSPRLGELRPLLEATERIILGTSIVNIWGYDPADLVAEYQELAGDFPDRVCVGIGVGHPEATSDYKRPFSALERFLDGIDAAEEPIPTDRRIIAALAPRMLAMCKERSLGTIPYFTSVEHTRFAREQVGPEAKLIVELACVLDDDAERARAIGREYAATYLALQNYTNALLKHGFEEVELENGGSDRLIDHVVPHGTAADVAERARQHRQAGADGVAFQPLGGDGAPVEDWRALASAMS